MLQNLIRLTPVLFLFFAACSSMSSQMRQPASDNTNQLSSLPLPVPAPTVKLADIQSAFKAPLTLVVPATDKTETRYALNTRKKYQEMREFIKKYGVTRFFQDMKSSGIFGENGSVVPTKKPFNVFANIIAGQMTVPYGDILTSYWGSSSDPELNENAKSFFIAENLPANDSNWNNPALASIGKASMSLRHHFMIPKDMHWSRFNVLTMGLDQGPYDVANSIKYLGSMKKAALEFVETERASAGNDVSKQWSQNIGLFFHCFPLNSVQYLHLHIVDLDNVGPAFGYYYNQNLNIDFVIDELKAELKAELKNEQN